MKKALAGVALGLVIAAGAYYLFGDRLARAGPNGGDLVPIQGGTAYAELLTNADTGEVLVNTWDKDLTARRPIAKAPITTVGSGDQSVELTPHPTNADPSGTCSRFYGHADWVRGEGVHNGWMRGGGAGDHHTFDWNRCWQAGRSHGRMWEEMGPHRRMGPGHMGGREDQ
jgi:hypothetical protein